MKKVVDTTPIPEMTQGDAMYICKNIFIAGSKEDKEKAISVVFGNTVSNSITKKEIWDVVRYLAKHNKGV